MKRAYSKDFPCDDDVTTYLLSAIPRKLWRRVRAQAVREDVSLRTLILRLLSEWLNGPARTGAPRQ